MKIPVETMDSVLFVLDLAKEQLEHIEYEVRERVQGTMYNPDDIDDAKEHIAAVQAWVDMFYA